ncbi:L-amino-acid oxidase [Madurella mycetomatis]|uniref:L-amino-acid oxidase n=1 Tax=Madurella mycetomatis TaxID=100816 RepID=A0A175W9W7_9PEZI|nr:L-amino-acid oxidase [Madurella mycetomatis]
MRDTLNYKARWAIELNRLKLAKEWRIARRGNLIPGQPDTGVGFQDDGLGLPPDEEIPDNLDDFVGGPRAPTPARKIGIVGAGISGLYAAMILEDLDIPNLSVEILEANSRVGGRVYTHNFSETTHDYYDVGAMRFPDIPSMARTFDLFRRTGVPQRDYYLVGPNTPALFNNRFFVPGVADPYGVSVSNGGNVPDDVADHWSDALNAAFRPYKEALAENWPTGFQKLMEADNLSTREFLMNGGPKGDEKKYDFFSVSWMETQNTATGLFDQAFSESVIDSFDFDNPIENVKWKCIEGGTSLVTQAMQQSLVTTRLETGKRVEGIYHNTTNNAEGNLSIKVAGEDKARQGYSTVFATAPLGCLARIDLSTLALHPSTRDAIRCLHYDDSVKVAMRFSRPWWRTESGITKGGVSNTDLSIRVCVYPSYNTDDPDDQPAVLLVSYSWSQDAARIGSLLKAGPDAERELVDFVLRDIHRLHAQTVTEDTVRSTFTGDWHAYSWSHDPHAAGAFALFAPGQFRNLYPYLIRPAADSKFHIVGEASSAHHAWIIGSLNSAYMAVYKFLRRFGLWEWIQRLEERWGTVDELDSGRNGSLHILNALGKLAEGQHARV